MKFNVKVIKHIQDAYQYNLNEGQAKDVHLTDTTDSGNIVELEDPWVQYDDVPDPLVRFPQFSPRIPAVWINMNDAQRYVQQCMNQMIYNWPEVNDYIGAHNGRNSVNVYVVVYPGFIRPGEPFDTMATDGRNIFVTPVFLWALAHRNFFLWGSWLEKDDELTPEEKFDKWPQYDMGTMFVLMHEIYHCLNMHRYREQKFLAAHPDINYNPKRGNILMDQEINTSLVAFLKMELYPPESMDDFTGTKYCPVPLLTTTGGILMGVPTGDPEMDSKPNINNSMPKEFLDKLYTEVEIDGPDGLTQPAIAQGATEGVNYKDFGWEVNPIRRYPTDFCGQWEEMYLWFEEHGWPACLGGEDDGVDYGNHENAGGDSNSNDPNKLPEDQDIYERGYYDGYYDKPPYKGLDTNDDYLMGVQDGKKNRLYDDKFNTDVNSPEYLAGAEAAENGDVNESKIYLNPKDYDSFYEMLESYKFGKKCGFVYEWVDIDRESDGWKHGVESVLKRRRTQGSPTSNNSATPDAKDDVDTQRHQGQQDQNNQNQQGGQQGGQTSDVQTPKGKRKGGNQIEQDAAQQQAQQNADKAQQNADNAKSAADKAQQAADAAQQAADRGDEQGAKDAAQQAGDATQQAGQEAQQAGQQAQQNGQNQQGQQASQAGQEAQQAGQQSSQTGQDGQSSAQDAANAAQQAADKAQQAANAAQQAANSAQQAANQQGGQSGQQGQGGESGQGEQEGGQGGQQGQGHSKTPHRHQTRDKNGNPVKNGNNGPKGGQGGQQPIDFNDLSKEEQQQIIDDINSGKINKTRGGKGGQPIKNIPGVQDGGKAGDLDWSKRRDIIDPGQGGEMARDKTGGDDVVDTSDPDDRWKQINIEKGGNTMIDADSKFQSRQVQNAAHSDWQSGTLATRMKIIDSFKSDINWQDKLMGYIRGAFKAQRERIGKKWGSEKDGYAREFAYREEVPGGESIGNIAFALDQSGSMWGNTGVKDKAGDGQAIPSSMRKFFHEISTIRKKIGKPIKGIATFSFSGGGEPYFEADYHKDGDLTPEKITIDKNGGTEYSHIFKLMKQGKVFDRKTGRKLWSGYRDVQNFPVVTVICTDSDVNGAGQTWNNEMWNTKEKLVIWFVIDKDASQFDRFREELKKLGFNTKYFIGITTDQI